jgi:tetratricopeptide (TPR) repeat protein
MVIRVLALFFLTMGICLKADSAPVIKTDPREWLLPLREALYEQQLNTDQIRPIYLAARTAAQAQNSGTALDLAFSRCEFLMGRALAEDKRNDEARVHFVEGMRLAEKALEAAPSAEAWLIRAENLSQNCALGPWTYTAANGLNVEKYAKEALALDRRNAAAQYLVAARWVFAPAAFRNLNRGIDMMTSILDEGDVGKDDLFNVYSAIGYGLIQQRKHSEARPWLLKALEIYPTNKHAADLLSQNRRGN